MDTPNNEDSANVAESDGQLPSESFRRLICQIENGSEEAIWRLVEDLSPHVYRVVKRRMSSSLTRRIGASDVVQATWASFLIRRRDLANFNTEDELRAYVVGIAMNKLRMSARAHLRTEARDCRREVPIEVNTDGLPVAKEPSPSEVVGFRENWNLFMEQQPEHYQEIVRLRVEGCKLGEIAQRLRINERTVRRVLNKLADTLVV